MVAVPHGMRASLARAAGWKGAAALALAAMLAACGSVAAPGSAGGPAAPGSSAGGSAGRSSSASPAASSGISSSGAGTSPGAAARGRLCADPGAVTKVMIVSTGTGLIRPLPQLPPGRFASAAGADPARALARAVCALPLMPKGVVSCPMQQAGQYTLRFWAGLRQLPVVRVVPTGCMAVTGAGPARRALMAAPFWRDLARAAGHRIQAADGIPVSS